MQASRRKLSSTLEMQGGHSVSLFHGQPLFPKVQQVKEDTEDDPDQDDAGTPMNKLCHSCPVGRSRA